MEGVAEDDYLHTERKAREEGFGIITLKIAQGVPPEIPGGYHCCDPAVFDSALRPYTYSVSKYLTLF